MILQKRFSNTGRKMRKLAVLHNLSGRHQPPFGAGTGHNRSARTRDVSHVSINILANHTWVPS